MNLASHRIKLCFLVWVLFVPGAGAHDLFLKPETFTPAPGEAVTIPFYNGSFTESEAGFASDRLRDLSIVSPAGHLSLKTVELGTRPNMRYFHFTPVRTGTTVVGASLKPRNITLSADDFNEYLAHDGIPDILAERQASNASGDVHEIYEKHVKTVLRVGTEHEGAFDAVLDYPAEIVLLNNPFAPGGGETLRFRCLVDGEPAANQFVLMGGTQDSAAIEELSTRTDAAGEATFPLNGSGERYIRFIHMTASDQEGIDYHSKWATITFEIP